MVSLLCALSVATFERNACILRSARQCRLVTQRHSHLLHLLPLLGLAPINTDLAPTCIRRRLSCTGNSTRGFFQAPRCRNPCAIFSLGYRARARSTLIANTGHCRDIAQNAYHDGDRFIRAHGDVDC